MRNGYFGIARCIAILIAVVAGFNMVGAIIMFAVYGASIKTADGSMLIIINAIAQLAVMLTVPILIVKSRRMNSQAVFRLEGMHETPLRAMVLGVAMILVTEVLGGGLDGLWIKFIQLFPPVYHALNSLQKVFDEMMGTITTAHSLGELIILLIGVSLVPAIAEETFFRGFIQTNIERSGKRKPRPYIAIMITSILFGAMHLSPMNLPGLALIGAVLGWLAYRTSDLRVSMLTHAMNNGLIVLATYFFQSSKDTVDALTGSPEISISDSLSLIAISLPFFIAALYIFQKMTDPLTARNNAAIEIEMLNRPIDQLIHQDVT
ncbi:MAG TPA: CPBP family intramembrane glutamic endopeptidase [Candidatus Kapabacteria bacterium]|nr:CPBP family intramembrane glutamic endopeptidase [Candidatus Kapabacteria bacterium]